MMWRVIKLVFEILLVQKVIEPFQQCSGFGEALYAFTRLSELEQFGLLVTAFITISAGMELIATSVKSGVNW